MIIEIDGVEFNNKGAELMLLTILQEISKRIPEARFVMRPRNDRPFFNRSKLGLYQKLEYRKYGVDWGAILGSFLPNEFKIHYGMIMEKDIDVLLDASGLGYSSKWGITPVKNASIKFSKMKKNGTKIIMLPQAFGPFDRDEYKKYLKRIIKNADLVFAREEKSKEILIEAVGEDPKIKVYPDFTNLLMADENLDIGDFSPVNKFCIIPNYRMIDKTDAKISDNYIFFMKTLIKSIIDKNEKVFILIHEGEKDLQLAKQIKSTINETDIDIIVKEDPIEIKKIISKSKGVVSSRYHGLVSGLSTGVPSLATGWNHKYKYLFKDYDFEEGMMDVLMPIEKIRNKLNALCDDKNHKILKNKLLKKSSYLKLKSNEMFDKVIDVIYKK